MFLWRFQYHGWWHKEPGHHQPWYWLALPEHSVGGWVRIVYICESMHVCVCVHACMCVYVICMCIIPIDNFMYTDNRFDMLWQILKSIVSSCQSEYWYYHVVMETATTDRQQKLCKLHRPVRPLKDMFLAILPRLLYIKFYRYHFKDGIMLCRTLQSVEVVKLVHNWTPDCQCRALENSYKFDIMRFQVNKQFSLVYSEDSLLLTSFYHFFYDRTRIFTMAAVKYFSFFNCSVYETMFINIGQ